MKRSFRKYHRFIALIVFIPLFVTLTTGILATIIDPDGWNLNLGIPRSLLLSIHTGEIVHLQAIYPVLNGLGLLAMIVTGLSMTSLFNQKPKRE
jgi:hypothetical protein